MIRSKTASLHQALGFYSKRHTPGPRVTPRDRRGHKRRWPTALPAPTSPPSKGNHAQKHNPAYTPVPSLEGEALPRDLDWLELMKCPISLNLAPAALIYHTALPDVVAPITETTCTFVGSIELDTHGSPLPLKATCACGRTNHWGEHW